MDDISAKLSEILSDPDSMQQLREMAKSLNLGGGSGGQNSSGEQNGNSDSGNSGGTPSFDPAMLQGMMNSLGMNSQPPEASQSGGIDPAMLQGMMNSLGMNSQPSEASQNGGIDPAMLQGLMSAMNGGQQSAAPSPDNGQMMQMMSAFSKMAPMMRQLNQEDDSTRLLMALKPMLSPARQKKLDEATKIMRMMRMIPLLRESGMMSSLFG